MLWPIEISAEQYQRIAPCRPVQRGNFTVPNHQMLNAILYVLEHGYQWRGLPEKFGNWHTVYTRMNRWSKNGALDRVFAALQKEGILNVKLLEVVSLGSTSVKVHPDGTGARQKGGCKLLASPGEAGTGPPRYIRLPRMTDGR